MVSDKIMDKEIAKSLARLTALKANIPQHNVGKKYADEFNSVVNILEEFSGDNLVEFKFPESEIKPIVVSFNMISGSKSYSAESFCDREYLLMKLDGVLGYFTLSLQPNEIKEQIGFHVE